MSCGILKQLEVHSQLGICRITRMDFSTQKCIPKVHSARVPFRMDFLSWKSIQVQWTFLAARVPDGSLDRLLSAFSGDVAILQDL